MYTNTGATANTNCCPHCSKPLIEVKKVNGKIELHCRNITCLQKEFALYTSVLRMESR